MHGEVDRRPEPHGGDGGHERRDAGVSIYGDGDCRGECMVTHPRNAFVARRAVPARGALSAGWSGRPVCVQFWMALGLVCLGRRSRSTAATVRRL